MLVKKLNVHINVHNFKRQLKAYSIIYSYPLNLNAEKKFQMFVGIQCTLIHKNTNTFFKKEI